MIDTEKEEWTNKVFGTCPECNEKKHTVVINTTPLNMSIYLTFREAKTDLCLRCWMKSQEQDLEGNK